MIPQTNQHVKCVLKNGAIVEGLVQQWDEQQVQLLSLDCESILIIVHPQEDIVLIKVLLAPKPNQKKLPSVKAKTELEQEFQQTYAQPSEDPLRTKKLGELKILLAEQERKIVAEKMKDHISSQSSELTTYHYPGGVSSPLPYQPTRIKHGHTGTGKKPRPQ